MSEGFDWTVLRHPQWTPLSSLPISARDFSGNLKRATCCVYLMTNPHRGDGQSPGVGAVLWAESEGAARLVYDQTPEPRDAGPICDPPFERLGFAPFTYVAALAYEKGRAERPPQLAASYRFTDGTHASTELSVVGRSYFFRALNPSDDEAPIAVQFALGR